MPLLLIGVNHKTANLEVRERFALSSEQGREMLERLAGYMTHAVVLATCNRTEIYTTVHNAEVASQHLQRFLADWTGLSTKELDGYLYTLREWDTVNHLFRVAAGLDSMILGEEQILGQVRNAMDQAQAQGTLDPVLAAAFRQAVRAGRQARSNTKISRNPVSVSSVAIDLAQREFPDLKIINTLVISAGEAGKLAFKSLAARGMGNLRVTSRTLARARELAAELGGEAVPFDTLPDALAWSDLIITATSAPDHVLSAADVFAGAAQRNGRRLLIIDIAVPRDVEPAVGDLDGVTLYNIDDVQGFAERNLHLRRQEITQAERIVHTEVGKFQKWWRAQDALPTIRALQHKAEAIRADELRKTLRRLPALSLEEQERLDAMSKAIVKKLLHDPVIYLKEQRDGELPAEVLHDLFGLNGLTSPEATTAGQPH